MKIGYHTAQEGGDFYATLQKAVRDNIHNVELGI